MASGLVLVNAGQPVLSLADAKAHLRVEHDAEDALILAMIADATARCESACNRSLAARQWRLTMDEFPGSSGVIQLERGPATAVLSIVYRDTDGAMLTMPAADYVADLDGPVGRIAPAFGKTWPVTQPQIGSVRVTYAAGYASPPPQALAWIRLQVGALYENREAIAQGKPVHELPGGFVDRLLDSLRVSLA